MILGSLLLGTVPVASSNTVLKVVVRTTQVNITVGKAIPDACATSISLPAVAVVTAHDSINTGGSNSFPSASRVIVRGNLPRETLASIGDAASVTVTAAPTSDRLVSRPPVSSVSVITHAPSQVVEHWPEPVNIAVANASPMQAGLVTSAAQHINVATPSSSALVRTAIPSVQVSVIGGLPSTRLSSTQTPVNAVVLAGVPRAEAQTVMPGVGISVTPTAIETAAVAGVDGAAIVASSASIIQGIGTRAVSVLVHVASSTTDEQVMHLMPGVVITARPAITRPTASNSPPTIVVTASANASIVSGAHRPTTAFVWVRGNALVEITEAALGLVSVLNANTLAVSEYNIPDAVDVAAHDGQLLFLTPSALLAIASREDSEGAPGIITTGELALSGNASASMNLARLDVSADAPLHMELTAHQDGASRSATYLIPLRDGVNSRHRRVKLGNGLSGNAFSFTLSPPPDVVCNWDLSAWAVEPGQARVRRR